MVTDEERDYMYADYAKDPRMKLNLGLRRTLAPLLHNSRDEIQLMSAILFSLPGSPVLYYAPPLMDPVHGYHAVNVEAQLRTATSMLRWIHRFIALRKEHPAFGFGSHEPIDPSIHRLFAHLRRFEDDLVLCAHNGARLAQAVELDNRPDWLLIHQAAIARLLEAK